MVTTGDFNQNIRKMNNKDVKLMMSQSLGKDNTMEIIKLTFDE